MAPRLRDQGGEEGSRPRLLPRRHAGRGAKDTLAASNADPFPAADHLKGCQALRQEFKSVSRNLSVFRVLENQLRVLAAAPAGCEARGVWQMSSLRRTYGAAVFGRPVMLGSSHRGGRCDRISAQTGSCAAAATDCFLNDRGPAGMFRPRCAASGPVRAVPGGQMARADGRRAGRPGGVKLL